MRVLVTGASGFIGKAIVDRLILSDYEVLAAVRSTKPSECSGTVKAVMVGDLNGDTDWSVALAGVDCVIHCAARAHVLKEDQSDSLKSYRDVNVSGTKKLAKQSALYGVKRFIFLSSIGVNGLFTSGPPKKRSLLHGVNGHYRDRSSHSIFTHMDAPSPQENYSISKLEAEEFLWSLSAQTGMEVVIVRPPLVYGPGVKGNMLRLLKVIKSGMYLPLGAVSNLRSLIGLSNLVDLLLSCTQHPDAAGKTFLACDGNDLSTPDLIKLIASEMNMVANLFPVPIHILRAGGFLLGQGSSIDRLIGSLQVDIEHTKAVLGWTPALSVQDGVREMVLWYLNQSKMASKNDPHI